jgi:DNA-binding response OmpR family regulator
MSTILVVEDEADLLHGLVLSLKKDGYEVSTARRGDEAVDAVLRDNPDLVLLDVMLPGMNGFDVCRDLRQKGLRVPVIMLTARGEEIDRVVGLELGADDYVTKPFSIRELLARVRARLRAREPHGDVLRAYRVRDLEIDFEACTVTRNGTVVEFGPKELDILRLLIRHRGKVVSRDRMLNEVWGYHSAPNTRTVDMHILKLRQKIEADPASPRHILSVYGEGYKFVD